MGIKDVRVREPLRDHGTWKIGGPADLLVQPASVEQLSGLLRYVNEHRIPRVIIGDGSNLLFDDAGFRGVVIRIGRPLSALHIAGTVIRVEAGIAVPRLARAAGLAGLVGLEHIVGIPASLGGLICMNGGSLRRNIGDVVRTVRAVDPAGELHNMSREECGFAYRTSAFQTSNRVVVGADLVLDRGDRREIRRAMSRILRERRRKFPRHRPNCGSVFVVSDELRERYGPPGKVIEDTGLKGLTVGHCEVSRKHANFIVHSGRGSSTDVRELIRRVRAAVHERTGFWMRCEVRYVPPEGNIRPLHEAL
jgi:UDP-N-acetylmuramate dehydrogenase